MLSGCSGSLETYTGACDLTPLPGGVKYLVFADGDIDTTSATAITDKTSAAQWQAALNAGAVEIVGEIMGSVPAATPNEQKVSSCSPAKAVNYAREIAFSDYNTTTDNTTFWNDIKKKSLSGKFGYVGCDGYFYGFVSGTVVTVSRVKDEDSDTGATYWQGTCRYTKMDEETPVLWPTTLKWS